MKKKIFCIALAAALLMVAAGLCILLSGNEFTVARCVVTEGGGVYMVYDGRPVLLCGANGANYGTGDRLWILHATAFAESDPEQVRTVFALRIGDGERADIPASVIEILTDLGNQIKE